MGLPQIERVYTLMRNFYQTSHKPQFLVQLSVYLSVEVVYLLQISKQAASLKPLL
jgi:hypothetical protein